MKFLNKIGAWSIMALAMVACVDQDPEIQDFPSAAVDFTYEVNNANYKTDYYVVTEIRFNNTSAQTGNLKWSFSTDKFEYHDGTDATSSNPIVKFHEAGRYNVTLTVEGVGSRTYPILIADIQPKLVPTIVDAEMVTVNETLVKLDLDLPNPENKTVKYTITFPAGTVDADGNSVAGKLELTRTVNKDGSYTDSKVVPQVKFSDIGSRRVTIDAVYDIEGENCENRPLEQGYYDVQVACSEPAPTLYYAEKGGNIKAMKIIADPDKAGFGIYPYNMGVVSGDNPFNICYGEYEVTDEETGEKSTQGYIFILDAGKQHYYTNDPIGLGDGKIVAMAVDGTNVNTVISNNGLNAYNDPYKGCIVGTELYYSDRNMGIRKIATNLRNEVETATDSYAGENYFVKDTWLNYYGAGITYGAIHSNIVYDAEAKVWWLGKHFNGNAIYRFQNGHIHKDGNIDETKPPYGKVLVNSSTTAFTFDDKYLYVWYSKGAGKGFYVYNRPAYDATNTDAYSTKELVAKFEMQADPVNTTADEGVYTTQMAVDAGNTGYVFFAFRKASDDNSAYNTAIYYYNPENAKLNVYGKTEANTEMNIKAEAGLGITINPNKTYLF